MKKKILFISIKYYDAEKNKGYSYEYNNFYLNLKKYFNISHLPIDEIIQKNGYDYLNNKILKIYRNYDILFFFMYKNDIYPSTLKVIKNNKKIKSIAWMSDDHWRYDIYGKHYIGFFDLIITTCKDSLKKYRCNKQKSLLGLWTTDVFINQKKKKHLYDVSFVGKNYGRREKYVNFLKKNNINVKCFGSSWPNSQFFVGNIKKIFTHSLINLNFSDSSTGFSLKNIVKVFFHKKTNLQYRLHNPFDYYLNLKNFCMNKSKQIKGRLFEAISSNSFVITEYHKDLSSFFKINKEIVCFKNEKELLEKTKFYMKNKNLLDKVKGMGYKKFKKAYAIKNYFRKIFT